MKNLMLKFTLLSAFFLFANLATAQKFMMENTQISYEDIYRTAVKITMEVEDVDIEEKWEDWIEDRYDKKVSGNDFLRKKDVLTCEDVLIPTISNNKINIYAEIKEQSQDYELYVFATLGNNILITPETYPSEYRALENLSLDFASGILVKYYRDQVKDSKESVSDLEEKRNELREDLMENKEEIVKLTQENIELEKEITTKAGQLNTASDKLDSDRKKMEKINEKLEAEKNAKKNNQ